jgi:hypothetical protein
MSEPSRLIQLGFTPMQSLHIARGFVGEFRFGLWTTSDQTKLIECGWLLCDGTTIGNAASGATQRASADCYDLFSHLWSRTSDTDLPIYTSAGAASTRGATAGADWDAAKRLALPAYAGCSPIGLKASGTASTLASKGGSVDITVKKHYHGMGTGADLNITSSGAHTHSPAAGGQFVTAYAGGGASYARTAAGAIWYEEGVTSVAHTHPAGNIAGRVGIVTGGVDGNTDQATSSTSPYFACMFIIGF